MTITFALPGKNDAEQFQHIAEGVFDADLSAASLQSFLNDQRHHILVAKDGETIIGFISAVDCVHPDKARELWINEVGVARAWRGQGIGKRLLSMMLDHGRKLGCAEAWVLTEPENEAANALYRSIERARNLGSTAVVMHSFKLA